MSKLGKISLLFAILTLLTFAIAKYLLGVWIPFFWILIGLFIFFIGMMIYTDRKFLGAFFTLKTTKHGMNMGVLILLTFSLLAIVNYLGVRKNQTWDLSAARSNTISDQSVQILKSLDSELRVLFFYKRGAEGNEENRKAFREIFKKYQDQTDKINLDFYEVNEHRSLAEEYGVTKGSGVAFLDYNGKRNRIEKVDEQEITSALVKVTRAKNKNIYFLVGHRELDLEEGKDPSGANLFKLFLENNSFNVKILNLTTSPQIPEDADTVVILGASQTMADYEVKVLEKYMQTGGQLFIALEGSNAGLDKFLGTLGIRPQHNFIKSSYMGIGFVDGGAIGNEFSPESVVTKNFFGKQEITRFGWPMDLKVSGLPPGISADVLVATNKDAYAFPTPEATGTNFPKGPFNLIISMTGKYPGSTLEKDFTLVVAGDAEFLNNTMLYQNLNRDVGLGIISSLAKEENIINITPREVEKTEMKIGSVNQTIFLFGIIFPLPLLLLGTSFALWLRRRNA
ncbi:MAG: Gldg family protein [Bdellovibrionota bacterium]